MKTSPTFCTTVSTVPITGINVYLLNYLQKMHNKQTFNTVVSNPFCSMDPRHHVRSHSPFSKTVRLKRWILNNMGRYVMKQHIICDKSVSHRSFLLCARQDLAPAQCWDFSPARQAKRSIFERFESPIPWFQFQWKPLDSALGEFLLGSELLV